jgi:hypothetical protein
VIDIENRPDALGVTTRRGETRLVLGARDVDAVRSAVG